jgi:hypothetical protein
VARIEIGRWSELLRRASGMAGVEIVSSEMSPEISPVFVVEGDTGDWDYLKHKKLFACQFSVPASVGEFSHWQLRNPPTSGTIAVIERITASTTASDYTRLMLNKVTTDYTTAAYPVVQDTRWQTYPGPPLNFNVSSLKATHEGDSGVGAGSIFSQQRLISNTPWTFVGPLVLTPGYALSGQNTTYNLAMSVTVQWSERKLQPLER